MNKKKDFLIVGAGMFGAVCARILTDAGFNCLVIDKRDHIAGNCYTENIENINVHKYGAHIFHTNDKNIWNFVNRFAEFNRYTNSPIANYQGRLYNLPFNMNTFYQIWGVKTPEEAIAKVDSQVEKYKDIVPSNLEEQALKLVGDDIYEILIKQYSKKQWGRDPKELPSFIIKRLPLRFTFDNNYFNDKFQGIPIGGYTEMFRNILNNIDVQLNINYLDNRYKYQNEFSKIIYTGAIDEFFDYKFGYLEYRSLKFEHEVLNINNFQGNAVVNYTDCNTEFTRIIEHKHFEFGNQLKTVITKEYSKEWEKNDIPYYPINNDFNNKIFNKYKELSKLQDKVIFGGRLAEYKYYDMHQVIGSAMNLCKSILRGNDKG